MKLGNEKRPRGVRERIVNDRSDGGRYCRSVIRKAEWVLQNAVVTSAPSIRSEEDTSTSFRRPIDGAGVEKAMLTWGYASLQAGADGGWPERAAAKNQGSTEESAD